MRGLAHRGRLRCRILRRGAGRQHKKLHAAATLTRRAAPIQLPDRKPMHIPHAILPTALRSLLLLVPVVIALGWLHSYHNGGSATEVHLWGDTSVQVNSVGGSLGAMFYTGMPAAHDMAINLINADDPDEYHHRQRGLAADCAWHFMGFGYSVEELSAVDPTGLASVTGSVW